MSSGDMSLSNEATLVNVYIRFVGSRLLSAYRRAGGDPPFVDLGGAHGTPMEGCFWRLADHERETVIVALHGIARSADDKWGVIGMGAYPPSTLVSQITGDVAAAEDRLSVSAGSHFAGSEHHLEVDLGESCRISARFSNHRGTPLGLGGLGLAHWVPGLPTYWTAAVMSADVSGTAVYEGREFILDGAKVYIEKNWGSTYPSDWWWGQSFFGGGEASVVFAGGELKLGPAALKPGVVVFQLHDEVIRLVPPLAKVHSSASADEWVVTARSPRCTVEIIGQPGDCPPVELPVPIPAERRTVPRALEHLAGRMAVTVRRGSHVLYEAESTLAGLEIGVPVQK